jgi:hypothetical protein
VSWGSAREDQEQNVYEMGFIVVDQLIPGSYIITCTWNSCS